MDNRLRELLRQYRFTEDPNLEFQILAIAERNQLWSPWLFDTLAILGDEQFATRRSLLSAAVRAGRSVFQRSNDLEDLFTNEFNQDNIIFTCLRAVIGCAIVIQSGVYLPDETSPGSGIRVAWGSEPDSPSMCNDFYLVLEDIIARKGVITNDQIIRLGHIQATITSTLCYQMEPNDMHSAPVSDCAHTAYAFTHLINSFNLSNPVSSAITHIVRAIDLGCREAEMTRIADYFWVMAKMIRLWMVNSLAEGFYG